MGEACGIWERVSTGQQDEASQRPDNQAWCDEHGYTVTREYILKGKSASKGQHQKKLDQVISDMENGIIKVLVVWKSNRIERRGAYNAFQLAEKVRKAGGRIEYVKDAYLNTANDMSDVMLALAATQDKMYSKNLSDTSKRTVARVRENGAFYGKIPFGYDAVGEKYSKQLVPNADGRKYIPEIFDRAIKGESFRSIAAWLAVETGDKWWGKVVGDIVRNPVYMGHNVGSDGLVNHTCEPLVDAAVFRKAQDRPKPRNGTRREYASLLSRVLFCPHCGGNSPMLRMVTTNTRKDGSKQYNYYYRCSGTGTHRRGCGNMVRLETADMLVDRIMSGMNEEIYDYKFIPGHNHEAEIEKIQFEIDHIGSRRLSRDEHRAELDRLWAEQDRLAALPKVPDEVKKISTGVTHAQRWNALEPSERGSLLRSKGIRVFAGKDQKAVLDACVNFYPRTPTGDEYGSMGDSDGRVFVGVCLGNGEALLGEPFHHIDDQLQAQRERKKRA